MIDSVMLFKLITEDSFAKHFLGISHNDWTWSAFLIATRQRFRTEQFSFNFKQHSNGKTSSRVFKEHLNKKWALLGAKRNIPAVLAWNFLYTSRTELSKYWQLDYDIGLIIYWIVPVNKWVRTTWNTVSSLMIFWFFDTR